jgi:hypothetical protein
MTGTLRRRLDQVERRWNGPRDYRRAGASLTDMEFGVVWRRVFGDSSADRDLTDDENLEYLAALYEFRTGKDAPCWDENGQLQSRERWFFHDRESDQVVHPRSGEQLCPVPNARNLRS